LPLWAGGRLLLLLLLLAPGLPSPGLLGRLCCFAVRAN
jgi:hypothetical protein